MIRFTIAGPALNNPTWKLEAPSRAAYTAKKVMVLPANIPNHSISKYKLRKFARCMGVGGLGIDEGIKDKRW
jgi:hypothetical protein